MHMLHHHPYLLVAMSLLLGCGCALSAIIIYLE